MMTRLKYLLAALLVAAGVAGPAPEPAAALLDQTITFQQVADVLLSSGSGVWTRVSSTTGFTIAVNSLTTGVCTIGGVYADEEVWEQDEPGLYVAHIRFQSAGTCRIVASQAGNSSYNPAPDVEQSFEIIGETPKLDQTITFDPIADLPLDANGHLVSGYSASSGLQVVVSSSTPAICTTFEAGHGRYFYLLDEGVCTLAINQSGNDVYNAAPQVTRSFNVLARLLEQTIVFDPLSNMTLAFFSQPLSAHTDSGLAVMFESLTSDICDVDETEQLVFAITAGTCTIAAFQEGDSVYNAAEPVEQSFEILAPAVECTLSFSPNVVNLDPETETFVTQPVMSETHSNLSGDAVLLLGNSDQFIVVGGADLESALQFFVYIVNGNPQAWTEIFGLAAILAHISAGGTYQDFDVSTIHWPLNITVLVAKSHSLEIVDPDFYAGQIVRLAAPEGEICSADLTVTNSRYTTEGFFAPVQMNGAVNRIRGGHKTRLKFRVKEGGTVISDTTVVQSFTQQRYDCTTNETIGELVSVPTSRAWLRYKRGKAQFAQKWHAPSGKKQCYEVTLTLIDGQTISARFRT